MDIFAMLFGARPDAGNAGARGLSVLREAPPNVAWRRARPRGSPKPVRARVAEADHEMKTRHGVLRAKAGEDFIVDHGEEDYSVVRSDIFDRTYEPLGGGLYRKRDDVVLRYFTLDRPVLVETLEGDQRADAGDWIMQGVTGELWPVSREKALEKYETL